MTYYEELGVAPDAPASEIRRAYRVLARLVHPDGQADEQVRGMAERQMQRLNGVLETLVDAERRREYDDSLLAPAPPPAIAAAKHPPREARFHRWPRPRRSAGPGWAGAVLLHWFWAVPAAMILGVGCWYMAAGTGRRAAILEPPQSGPGPEASDRKPQRQPREASHPPAAAVANPRKTEPAAPAATPVRGVATAASSQPDWQPAPARPDLSAAPASTQSAPPYSAPPAAPESAPAKPESTRGPAPASSAPPTFAGAWLYVPDSGEASAPGVYPPTYVEFLLTEERGELTGTYRARYRIPDRAVSPEVLFRAQGKPPEGDSAKLVWMSADGARGEVEMRLHGPNAMSVTWWTTEFGRHPSLASGAAKLLRQRVP